MYMDSLLVGSMITEVRLNLSKYMIEIFSILPNQSSLSLSVIEYMDVMPEKPQPSKVVSQI